MLRVHTKMTPDQARFALQDLVASGERATGQIDGDKFRLHPKPRRRRVPVTLRGRLAPESGGTRISAWSFPHWLMILWFPVWAWFGIELVHAPTWFVVLGFLVGVVSFVDETRRGYDLLRQTYAA
jgi:hypothetical protein